MRGGREREGGREGSVTGLLPPPRHLNQQGNRACF